MLYNKNKVSKVNDKKVLHKVRKHWVTVSIAMLSLLGGGAVATHATASANSVNGQNGTQPNSNNTLKARINSNLQKVQPTTQQQPQQKTSSAGNVQQNITNQAAQLHNRILNSATQNPQQQPQQKTITQKTQPEQKTSSMNTFHIANSQSNASDQVKQRNAWNFVQNGLGRSTDKNAINGANYNQKTQKFNVNAPKAIQYNASNNVEVQPNVAAYHITLHNYANPNQVTTSSDIQYGGAGDTIDLLNGLSNQGKVNIKGLNNNDLHQLNGGTDNTQDLNNTAFTVNSSMDAPVKVNGFNSNTEQQENLITLPDNHTIYPGNVHNVTVDYNLAPDKQGNYQGLTYIYNPNTKSVEFTGGNLNSWNNYQNGHIKGYRQALIGDQTSAPTNIKNAKHIKFDSDVSTSAHQPLAGLIVDDTHVTSVDLGPDLINNAVKTENANSNNEVFQSDYNLRSAAIPAGLMNNWSPAFSVFGSDSVLYKLKIYKQTVNQPAYPATSAKQLDGSGKGRLNQTNWFKMNDNNNGTSNTSPMNLNNQNLQPGTYMYGSVPTTTSNVWSGLKEGSAKVTINGNDDTIHVSDGTLAPALDSGGHYQEFISDIKDSNNNTINSDTLPNTDQDWKIEFKNVKVPSSGSYNNSLQFKFSGGMASSHISNAVGNQVKNINFSGLDTSNVNNMEGMLINNDNLSNVNFGNIDTSKVQNMGMMLGSDANLTNVDMSNLNGQSLKTMYDIFDTDPSLVHVKLGSNLSSKQPVDLQEMFASDFNLPFNNIDWNGFSTKNANNMSGMFRHDENLGDVVLPSTFDTSNVTDFGGAHGGDGMFQSDGDNKSVKGMTNLDLSNANFDTSKATNMKQMFENDKKLHNINLGNKFNTANVTDMTKMFGFSDGFSDLTLPAGFDTSKAYGNMNNMFESDQPSNGKLNTIKIQSMYSKINPNAWGWDDSTPYYQETGESDESDNPYTLADPADLSQGKIGTYITTKNVPSNQVTDIVRFETDNQNQVPTFVNDELISGTLNSNFNLPSSDIPRGYQLSNDGTQNIQFGKESNDGLDYNIGNQVVHVVHVKTNTNNNIPVSDNTADVNGLVKLHFETSDGKGNVTDKIIPLHYHKQMKADDAPTNILNNLSDFSANDPQDILNQLKGYVEGIYTNNYSYDDKNTNNSSNSSNNTYNHNTEYNSYKITPSDSAYVNGSTVMHSGPIFNFYYKPNNDTNHIKFIDSDGKVVQPKQNSDNGGVNINGLDSDYVPLSDLKDNTNTPIANDLPKGYSINPFNNPANIYIHPNGSDVIHVSNGASNKRGDTLLYVNKANGHTVGSYRTQLGIHDTALSNNNNGVNDTVQNNVPNGYSVANNASDNVNYDGYTHVIWVNGTPSQNQSLTIDIEEKDENGNYIDQDGNHTNVPTINHTVTVPVNGNIGDNYSVIPSQVKPSNYSITTSDKPLNGTINANGLSLHKDGNYLDSQGNVIWVYDQKPITNRSMIVYYHVNNPNGTVVNSGAQNESNQPIGKSINYSDIAKVPTGYHLAVGQPTSGTVHNGQQIANLVVKPDSISSDNALNNQGVHVTTIYKNGTHVLHSNEKYIPASQLGQYGAHQVNDVYTIGIPNSEYGGYTADSTDKPLIGRVLPDGLSHTAITFVYNAKAKNTHIHFVGPHVPHNSGYSDNNVHNGSDINVDPNKLPNGYHVVPGQHPTVPSDNNTSDNVNINIAPTNMTSFTKLNLIYKFGNQEVKFVDNLPVPVYVKPGHTQTISPYGHDFMIPGFNPIRDDQVGFNPMINNGNWNIGYNSNPSVYPKMSHTFVYEAQPIDIQVQYRDVDNHGNTPVQLHKIMNGKYRSEFEYTNKNSNQSIGYESDNNFYTSDGTNKGAISSLTTNGSDIKPLYNQDLGEIGVEGQSIDVNTDNATHIGAITGNGIYVKNGTPVRFAVPKGYHLKNNNNIITVTPELDSNGQIQKDDQGHPMMLLALYNASSTNGPQNNNQPNNPNNSNNNSNNNKPNQPNVNPNKPNNNHPNNNSGNNNNNNKKPNNPNNNQPNNNKHPNNNQPNVNPNTPNKPNNNKNNGNNNHPAQSNQVIDTIDFAHGNQVITEETKQGTKGASFDVDNDVPRGYNVNSNTKFIYDGGVHVVQLGINRPNGNQPANVTPVQPSDQNNNVSDAIDTVDFVHGDQVIKSMTVRGQNGTTGNVSNAVPSGYIAQNTQFTYDNGLHLIPLGVTRPNGNQTVPVTPIQPNTPNNNQPNNNKNKNNGNIQPSVVLDTVQFINGSNIVKSENKAGLEGTNFNVANDAPAGYKLASTTDFTQDGGTHIVLLQAPSNNTNPNKNANNGNVTPTPQIPNNTPVNNHHNHHKTTHHNTQPQINHNQNNQPVNHINSNGSHVINTNTGTGQNSQNLINPSTYASAASQLANYSDATANASQTPSNSSVATNTSDNNVHKLPQTGEQKSGALALSTLFTLLGVAGLAGKDLEDKKRKND